MATDEVMKNYFARFIGHEMMFMVFSSDFHGIFTNLSFIVVVTFQKFIVMQMTPNFIYRLTQAVLLVKMRQLDQWKPVSGTLSCG